MRKKWTKSKLIAQLKRDFVPGIYFSNVQTTEKYGDVYRQLVNLADDGLLLSGLGPSSKRYFSLLTPEQEQRRNKE